VLEVLSSDGELFTIIGILDSSKKSVSEDLSNNDWGYGCLSFFLRSLLRFFL
jgi:hypothetical protein